MNFSGVALLAFKNSVKVIHGNLFGFSSEDAARGKFISLTMAKHPGAALVYVSILDHTSLAGIDDAEA